MTMRTDSKLLLRIFLAVTVLTVIGAILLPRIGLVELVEAACWIAA